MTKLHNALMAGKDGAALALIAAGGIDLNAQNDMGYTALMLALAQFQNGVAKALLDKGVRTDLTDKRGKTALELARDCGNDEGRNMMYRLLDRDGIQRETLHAAREGHTDALAFLVDELNASLVDRPAGGKNAQEEAGIATAFNGTFDAVLYIDEKLEKFPDDAGRDMHRGAKKPVAAMKPLVLRKS